jgi:hypothetical protein
MSVGHQEHRRVPMAPTVALGGRNEPLYLALRQVLAGAKVRVGEARGHDCSFYGGWRDQLQVRFRHAFGPPRANDCLYNAPSPNSPLAKAATTQ